MKKIYIIKKIIMVLLLTLLANMIFLNYSQATVGEIFTGADGFLENGTDTSNVINEEQLQATSSFMTKLLTAIGIVIMFVVGIIIGIQFMVASAEDKAKVKEALIPYIIGCAVIFGAFTIWNIAVKMGQGTSSGGASGGGRSNR